MRSAAAWRTGSNRLPAPRTPDEWNAARLAIGVQGRIWRELLTGEKAARDILSLSDYHAAALRVGRPGGHALLVVYSRGDIADDAISFAGTYLHSVPLSLRVVGDIAWLAGAFGIALKGSGARRTLELTPQPQPDT